MKSIAHLALPEVKQGCGKSKAAPQQAHTALHRLQRIQPTLWYGQDCRLLLECTNLSSGAGTYQSHPRFATEVAHITRFAAGF